MFLYTMNERKTSINRFDFIAKDTWHYLSTSSFFSIKYCSFKWCDWYHCYTILKSSKHHRNTHCWFTPIWLQLTGKRTCSWRICSSQWFSSCTSRQDSGNPWWWCSSTQTIWRRLDSFCFCFSSTNQVWFIRSSINSIIIFIYVINFLFLYYYNFFFS